MPSKISRTAAAPSLPRSATISSAPNSRAIALAILVPRHGHDARRAETLRGEHGGQADGAVADDGHGAAGS